ncbi:MAG: hypothetical protein HYS38_04945 [Acidobacteria bacterium]|nr:hypothetical protein [Acidobacteriota bacterium]
MEFKIRNYAHPITSDIDPNARVSAKKCDGVVNTCVARATEALKGQVSGYTDWDRSNIAWIFEIMQCTHKSIRILLSPEEPKPTSVDSLPLARVQLESLYALCLMLEDPKWVKVYVKDGWKKQYRRFLLEKEEGRNLSRFEEPLRQMQPIIEKLQQICAVTEAEKGTIEKEELDVPLPVGIAEAKIEQFPTPKRVIRKISELGRKKMLFRLYAEYGLLSSYVHGLPAAATWKLGLGKYKDLFSSKQKEDIFQKEIAGPAIFLSCLSVIQSASELTRLYPNDVELRAAAADGWNLLSTHSLLGKVVWEIRSKALLGAVS